MTLLPPDETLSCSTRSNLPKQAPELLATHSDNTLPELLKHPWQVISVILVLGAALRAAVALHPYSGEQNPPMYGDYEAHRHWMEVTLNVPISEWYVNSSRNDLSYWGLDYPPLSAYASVLYGRFVQKLEPSAMQLDASRGHETPTSRQAMRLTVLISDLLLFFPSLLAVLTLLFPTSTTSQYQALSFALTSPALVLIDHAHFQYNNVTLAFFLLSIYFLCRHRETIALIFFCASVYFKQTSLYFTLPVASWLFSRFLYHCRVNSPSRGLFFATKLFAGFALSTVITFLPWVNSKALLKAVIDRLIPISRGLYEDKVSNVWCSLSPIVKLQSILSSHQLFSLCAIMTFISSLPFCIAVVRKPSPKRLLLSSSGCALSAYLFSYQVHEKQVLLPLLPLIILYPVTPLLSSYLSFIATVSIFPLIWKESSHLAYFGMLAVHAAVASVRLAAATNSMLHKEEEMMSNDGRMSQFTFQFQTRHNQFFQMFFGGNLVLCSLLHFLLMFANPPTPFPFLFQLVITSYACVHLCTCYILLIFSVFSSD